MAPIFEKIKGLLSKQLASFSDTREKVEKLPVFPEWFFTARIGQPRSLNVVKIRTFSRSPWIQMVLNTIKKEVTNIEWEIIKKDTNDNTDYTQMIQDGTNFLNQLNSEMESFDDLSSMSITDLGEIDADVSVNVFSVDSYEYKDAPIIDDLGNIIGTEKRNVLKPFGQRKLIEVRPADSSTFLKQIDVYRRLQAYYQYSFKNPRTNPIRFEPAEVNYTLMNKKSYSIYGFSPVQAIQQVLELLIQSTRWNKEFYKNNAIPDGALTLPGADEASMKQFKREWFKEAKGKPHKMLFLNVDSKFQNFGQSSRDMEWLEGQKWYHWLVFAMFGVSPVEAGFHENVSQGNTDGQERITVKNAIKPYLQLRERTANRILKEFFQTEELPIEFKYFPKDHTQEKIEHEQDMAKLDRGVITINEYRIEHGMDEVDWGSEPMNVQMMNSMNEEDDDEDEDDDKGPKDNNDGKKSNPQAMIKDNSDIIDPGEDVVDESEDYEAFMVRMLKQMEKKVIAAISKVPIEKVYIEKTFGEFLSDLMNSVNLLPFVKRVKVFVRRGLMNGMESAEEEVGVDIGFTEAFRDKVKTLANQQLTGYTMPTGEAWHGIQGASKDLQIDILKSVQEDVINKVPRKEMIKNVQEVFQGSGFNRAARIARTESNRFINEGKLTGYIESGIPGRKAYDAVGDEKTSPICRRLSAKYDKGIPFDEEFTDDKTGKHGQNPPFAHPNCRCIIAYRKA